MPTKAGYVAIVGKPNAGKSTLLNQLIGAKLSIVTPKIQTTRKRILGILTEDDYQIVFLDTPGILTPKHELHKAMVSYIDLSLKEADIILVLFEAQWFDNIDTYFETNFAEELKKSQKIKIAVFNKIDLVKDNQALQEKIEDLKKIGLFDDILTISALENKGITELIESINKFLPYSEFYYDPELLSTQPQRFFVSELIRENVFMLYEKEIPYSTEVLITDFKEREGSKWYIAADIIVERQSQKGILIGKNGQKIKELGQKSRIAIEDQLQMEVFLELFVKVRENWRKKEVFLKSFGY
jgi:GTP-binding protein Era